MYAAETESEEEAFQAIRDFKSLKKKVLPLGVDGEVFFVQVNPTGWWTLWCFRGVFRKTYALILFVIRCNKYIRCIPLRERWYLRCSHRALSHRFEKGKCKSFETYRSTTILKLLSDTLVRIVLNHSSIWQASILLHPFRQQALESYGWADLVKPNFGAFAHGLIPISSFNTLWRSHNWQTGDLKWPMPLCHEKSQLNGPNKSPPTKTLGVPTQKISCLTIFHDFAHWSSGGRRDPVLWSIFWWVIFIHFLGHLFLVNASMEY